MADIWLYICAASLISLALFLGYRLGKKHGYEEGASTVLALKDKEIETLKASRTKDVSELAGKIAGLKDALDEEKNRQKREEEKRRKSPFARDFEPDKPFEVTSVPYGTVVCRASVQVRYEDLETLTKEELLRQLRAEILKEASHYVEVRQIEDPCNAGVLVEGRLRVLERK